MQQSHRDPTPQEKDLLLKYDPINSLEYLQKHPSLKATYDDQYKNILTKMNEEKFRELLTYYQQKYINELMDQAKSSSEITQIKERIIQSSPIVRDFLHSKNPYCDALNQELDNQNQIYLSGDDTLSKEDINTFDNLYAQYPGMSEPDQFKEEEIIDCFLTLPTYIQLTKLKQMEVDEQEELLQKVLSQAPEKTLDQFFNSPAPDLEKRRDVLKYVAEEIEKNKTPPQEIAVRTILLAGLISGVTVSLIFPPAGIGVVGVGLLTVLAFKVSDIIVSRVGQHYSTGKRKEKYRQEVKEKIAGLTALISCGIILFFAPAMLITPLVIMAISYAAYSTMASICSNLGKMMIYQASKIDAQRNPERWHFFSKYGHLIKNFGDTCQNPIDRVLKLSGKDKDQETYQNSKS